MLLLLFLSEACAVNLYFQIACYVHGKFFSSSVSPKKIVSLIRTRSYHMSDRTVAFIYTQCVFFFFSF